MQGSIGPPLKRILYSLCLRHRDRKWGFTQLSAAVVGQAVVGQAVVGLSLVWTFSAVWISLHALYPSTPHPPKLTEENPLCIAPWMAVCEH